ncbi:D6/D11-like helicase [Tunisvirus fontaine2]|uniref:D6/D11-like helicase n=2 Tax=Marseilleviridae TaxID=944644 RepID=V9SGF5_9VIRU|nr:D6/D11-like helicase [Tunisvirus fontaine2]AGS07292.1 D6/D11 helicase [Tunisvirus]AHC54842.1 D6/D11-like helicase [Tunisvirus fontaine2]
MLSKAEILKWTPKEDGGLTMDELCLPRKFALQMHQLFVEDYMGPEKDHKRILLFHGLGSGKTCETIRIAEANLAKSKKKVLVLLPASLEPNFIGELLSECTGDIYISKKDREYLKKKPDSDRAEEAIASAKKKIRKKYDIMSYQKFYLDSKKGKIDLGDYQLLVIDEVQNILGKLWYESLMKELKQAPKELKIVLLSATPIFDDEIEIAKTLNILKLDDDPFILQTFKNRYLKADADGNVAVANMDEFKNRIQGLVSYVRGANPAAYPKVIGPKTLVCKMSKFQEKAYSKYESAPKELRKKNLEYNNSIYKAERQASNLVYPNGSCGSTGKKSETKGMWKMPELEKYSCKFATLVKKLKKDPRLAFVYSNFVNYGGAASIADALNANGFSKYGTKDKKPKYALFTGSETKEERERVVKAFNRPKNADGSVIQVMIGSKSIAEGVSLLRVRQVHIIDPFFNSSTIEQAIGRAVRFCSQKDLPEGERDVQVWLYRARGEHGRKLVDDKIYDEIVEPKKVVAEGFLEALKESAVDCQIFRKANGGKVKCFKPDKNFVVPKEATTEQKRTAQLPRLVFKKDQTTVSGTAEKKKKFLEALKENRERGVKVSWNTTTETKEIGEKRKRAVVRWLAKNGFEDVKVKLREMASSSLSFGTRRQGNPKGEVGGKKVPSRKNPYPGCPVVRRPTRNERTGVDECKEGSEARFMKSGVKCCYKKRKGVPRPRKVKSPEYTVARTTSSNVLKKTAGALQINGKNCGDYKLEELKEFARKFGVRVSGTKAQLCERLEKTTMLAL